MRVLKAVMISTLLMVPAGGVWADTPVPSLITVTGDGSVDAAPDLAVLSMGVATNAKTATQAMAQNTAALAVVLDRLKSAGIAERDLQTSNLSLNPNWTGYDSGTPKITGYTAVNQLTVRIRALDTLGVVLDAAITDGANTVNGLSFALSDPRPAMDKARVAAVADARAKATLLVKAAGAGLGRIVSMTEGGGMQPGPVFKTERMLQDAPVPIAGGEVSTDAQVTVVFEITQ
jgi:uncharacterized protein YggE